MALYLIECYEINYKDELFGVKYVDVKDIIKTDIFKNTYVKIPEEIDKSQYKDFSNIQEEYTNANLDYNVLGIVIKNTLTGVRSKLRNKIYEEIHNLKGNNVKVQFQYLTLRSSGSVAKYLKYFPESKQEFNLFKDQVHLFTKTLYENYIGCYIKKEKPLKEWAYQYRTHMYNLHQQYLTEINNKNKKYYISFSRVVDYFNLLHQQNKCLH